MPKQFHELLGIPMLWWSVRAFHQADPETRIVIVMHPGFWDDWDIIYRSLPEEDRRIPLILKSGGRSRTESVQNGIMDLPQDAGALIAVHDAARPMITPELVDSIWECAASHGSAVPCVDEVNSLRKVEGESTRPVDRAEYLVVQTPQTFRADILHQAYARRQDSIFTDDASLVQRAGYPIKVCSGIPENLKVTTPMDFRIAEVLLKK